MPGVLCGTRVTSNRVNKANLIKQLQDEIVRLKSQVESRWNTDEQIAQLEAVCTHFKDALEQEKSRSEALAAERAACLKEMGLSVNSEGVSVVVASQGDAGVPYLVNLSEDPYLQGCLMYFLPGPEVTIGSSDGNNVRMSGLGMKPRHCRICNEGNRKLVLHPIAASDEKDIPRVLLNGRRVTEAVQIQHQDRLILGHAWAFRVAVPLTASELRAADTAVKEGGTHADSQAELDQAVAEIEDSSSQSFQHLRKFVEDLEKCAGTDCARTFVRELHRAVPLVDEANQITREVGVDSYFELQVLTDLWDAETNLPELVVAVLNTAGLRRTPTPPSISQGTLESNGFRGLWQPKRKGRGDLKFVWTFGKFLSRLQSMRDLYEESGGSRAVLRQIENEPFSNPWRELEEQEVRMLVLKSSNIGEARSTVASPATEARLMLHGLKSGNFGIASPSAASLTLAGSGGNAPSPMKRAREVEALDAKSDELLAKSQFLLDDATNVLSMQNAPPFVQHARSNRSTILEGMDPEEQLRLEELEQQVEEGMKKFQLYMGRRHNPSGASSWFGTGTGSASPTPKAAAAGSKQAMVLTNVPEVDFSPFQGVDVPPPGTTFVPNEAQCAVGKQLREILTTHGFVYAAGLVPSEIVAEAFATSRAFFSESTNREALQPLNPETNTGYGRMGGEALNARRANDLKEVFNLRKAAFEPGAKAAEGTPEGFMPAPVVTEASPEKSDVDDTSAIPCGEHTDFGAVTLLLLEDGAPGLEARRPEGGWMPAHGKKNTILLNTGALLARWYEITISEEKSSTGRVRKAEEFATTPGANGTPYPPITAGDFLLACLNGSLKGQVGEEAKRTLVAMIGKGLETILRVRCMLQGTGTLGKMSEVRPGAAPSDSTGRPREAQGSASSSFSEGLSWGIEDALQERLAWPCGNADQDTEFAETARFPSSAGGALPTTDEDARSLKEALQEALHAENTLLEREVERQRAEIQELKSRPRAAATPMMEPRAIEEPRAIDEPTVVRRVVPPAGVLTAPIQATPASATLSAPTPPRSPNLFGLG
eukprot:s366_g2.t1